MADLRKRFIEDYAGGLLNVARQELSTTGEVLAQDGLTSEGTLFVEDGTGTKSGLKLGVSLAEAIDPTTELGIVNVRYADRTYAKIRDLKIFSTAIASAQAALSEATSVSISNLETTLQLLEDDINTVEQNFQQNLADGQQQLQTLNLTQRDLAEKVSENVTQVANLESRIKALETPVAQPREISKLDTTLNSLYFSGTIEINGPSVTGSNGSQFENELSVGDTFLATDSTGAEIEFTVTAFSSQSPSSSMTVTPINKTVAPNSKFRRNQDLALKEKINELLDALKELKLIV